MSTARWGKDIICRASIIANGLIPSRTPSGLILKELTMISKQDSIDGNYFYSAVSVIMIV